MARSLKDIADRLARTQVALGISSAELCRETGISPSAWTQFVKWEKYKRRITLTAAFKLKDRYGITLEWIYDGDPARLPYDLAIILRKAA